MRVRRSTAIYSGLTVAAGCRSRGADAGRRGPTRVKLTTCLGDAWRVGPTSLTVTACLRAVDRQVLLVRTVGCTDRQCHAAYISSRGSLLPCSLFIRTLHILQTATLVRHKYVDRWTYRQRREAFSSAAQRVHTTAADPRDPASDTERGGS